MNDSISEQSSKPHLEDRTLQVQIFFAPKLWYSKKDELKTKKDEFILRTKTVTSEKSLVAYANIQEDILNLLSVGLAILSRGNKKKLTCSLN